MRLLIQNPYNYIITRLHHWNLETQYRTNHVRKSVNIVVTGPMSGCVTVFVGIL